MKTKIIGLGTALVGIAILIGTVSSSSVSPTHSQSIAQNQCDSSYPDFCIPPYSADLDCNQVPYQNFRVLSPDRHGFDQDRDGIGCER